MINVRKYEIEDAERWDGFVGNSKNGTFMLKRGFMDYHSDRFQDASLLFYEGEALVAVLPASSHTNELRSHGGLTYGGLIVGKEMTVAKELEIFSVLREYMSLNGYDRLIYKRVPSIYYSYPSDEDLYALFRNGAKMFRCDASTTIDLTNAIPFSSIRRRMVKKAQKFGIDVRQTDDYNAYIELLTTVLLTRHNVRPPHTGEELRLLASRFPNVIRLFCAYAGDRLCAGVLIFDTPNVIHAQYIASSETGRKVGALDLVMDYLIHVYSRGKKYFDFGISTEDNGRLLNQGLIGQKEMFGGRTIAYEFFELANSCNREML